MVSRKPRFRPMGIGDIFDEAFELYKSNFVLLASIAAVLFMPVLFLATSAIYLMNKGVASMSMGATSPDAAYSNIYQAIVAVCVRFAIVMLISPVVIGAFTYAISRRFTGEVSSLKECLGFVFRRIGAVYLTGLVVLLMVFIPNSAVLAGLYWGWQKFGQAALFGAVLLIPSTAISVFFLVKTLFAAAAVIVEEKKYFSAISRSWQLSKGHFWRILLIMLLFVLIAYILHWIISMPLSIVATVGVFTSMMAGKNPSMVLLLVMGAVEAIITGLIIPIICVVSVLLYYDVRIRKEGFDLQMLARELASSSGTTCSTPTSVETNIPAESESNEPR